MPNPALQRIAARWRFCPNRMVSVGPLALRASVGAANRDLEEFPHSDEFRLDRDLRNHVAFGMGIHYRLGAPLARAEASITLNAFLDRFPTLRRGATPAMRQTATPIVLGFSQLPLVLTTRPKKS
jgi:cytochrome P450